MSNEDINTLLADLNKQMDRIFDKGHEEYYSGMFQGLALASNLIRQRLNKDHPAAIC